jgi:hypothetical protein
MAPGLLNTNDTPRLGCEERDDDRVYCAGRRDVYGCSGFRFCVLSFNPITNRSASSSVARCGGSKGRRPRPEQPEWTLILPRSPLAI